VRLGAASLLAGLALSALSGAGAPPDPRTPAPPPARGDSLAGAPIEPILKDYRVLAWYELLPASPAATRADYSGITVLNERPSLNLWLVDDKAKTMATALSTLYLKLPGRPDTLIHAVRPMPLDVDDTRGLPLGDDIEDLVQCTFQVCVARRATLRADGSFRGFMFGVARHLLIDHLRRRYRRGEHEDVEQHSLRALGTSPSAAVARDEREALVREAMLRISLEQRMILELAHWEGCSGREIAEALEIGEHTVRSRLARARAALREQVEALGGQWAQA